MSKRQLTLWAVMSLAAILAMFVLAVAGVAAADSIPASQPVVELPSQGPSWWQWFCANSLHLIPLAVLILSSVITGLTQYPKAQGVVTVLRILVGILSGLTFKDSPGTFKAPLTKPVPPR